MSFLFVNKTLPLNNLKTRTAMNAKLSVLVICVKVNICLLLCNLHDCTFKNIAKRKLPMVKILFLLNKRLTNLLTPLSNKCPPKIVKIYKRPERLFGKIQYDQWQFLRKYILIVTILFLIATYRKFDKWFISYQLWRTCRF